MSRPILEFQQLQKAFFGVPVLKNISFTVPEGSILGIVGENGAGKSTLMNILGGNLRADAGRILVNGQTIERPDPKAAERLGIAFIHQELNLFPNLSIAENLFLTRFPRRGLLPWIDRAHLRQRAQKLLQESGLDFPPETLVEKLSAGERQLLEIAKALSFDARIMIFDEPTTSLTAREVESFFALLGRLRTRGITMIYISHILPDVFRLCDHLLVLRDGEVVGQGTTASFTPERLISLMVGRTLDQVFPSRPTPRAKELLLEAKGLSTRLLLRNISFRLHSGEILGLAGLMGAGRSELARVLFGLDRQETGEVILAGSPPGRLSPRTLIRRGLAFLTENRRTEGLCLDTSIADNLALAALPSFASRTLGWLQGKTLQSATDAIRQTVHLDAKARHSQPARTLSGGNQQKVVLGKWLLTGPRVLILDEPTRGVDVGAKSEIYRLIAELSASGVGILLISSELEELIGLSDRIIVMRQGQLVDEVAREQFDRERLLRAALGAHP